MSEMINPRYLADLERWRRVANATTVKIEHVDDLPANFRKTAQSLDRAFQERFLAWFPMLQKEAGRRQALIEKLLDLGTSGRASCVEEFQLAIAFTVYNADGADRDDTKDRLDRLEALFSETAIPWDALDQFFVVLDDANPLYDQELTRRRAPVIHVIAAKLPDEFSPADLEAAGAPREAIPDALNALESVELIERVEAAPDERWRKTELFTATDREFREFFEQHKISTRRDMVLVTAAWFGLKDERTFTRSDIAQVAALAGHTVNPNTIAIALSCACKDGLLRRVAHGVYEVLDDGVRYTHRLRDPQPTKSDDESQVEPAENAA